MQEKEQKAVQDVAKVVSDTAQKAASDAAQKAARDTAQKAAQEQGKKRRILYRKSCASRERKESQRGASDVY